MIRSISACLGDLFLFKRSGVDAVIDLDLTELESTPLLRLDHANAVTVDCDYFLQRFSDPPIIELRLAGPAPLIFGNDSWPEYGEDSGLVRVSTEGRAGQQVWLRAGGAIPMAVKTYFNISEDEPVGNFYLSELTIFADAPSAVITGLVEAQASDLHFDSHRNERTVRALRSFFEYGMVIPESDRDNGGVSAHQKCKSRRQVVEAREA
jgi:hypothetical protein